MTIKKSYIFYGLLGLFLTLLTFSGTIMSQVNEPNFKLIDSKDNIEIRLYAPLLSAEVTVEGERQEAISKGFRLLADFIFGNNTTQQKIDMTAPVIQQSGEKINMTAPVIQQESNQKDLWKIRFVMPAEYTKETLPNPNNKAVHILNLEAKKYAVIKFSGSSTQENLQKHLETLQKYTLENEIKTTGSPVFAFYNPPWTLPFMRRNEIMIEVSE